MSLARQNPNCGFSRNGPDLVGKRDQRPRAAPHPIYKPGESQKQLLGWPFWLGRGGLPAWEVLLGSLEARRGEVLPRGRSTRSLLEKEGERLLQQRLGDVFQRRGGLPEFLLRNSPSVFQGRNPPMKVFSNYAVKILVGHWRHEGRGKRHLLPLTHARSATACANRVGDTVPNVLPMLAYRGTQPQLDFHARLSSRDGQRTPGLGCVGLAKGTSSSPLRWLTSRWKSHHRGRRTDVAGS